MSELRSDKKVSEKSGVGVALRTRREELEWSLEEVAEALKLRPATLDALESETYDRLPGKAYALGFLKSYATYLGLDADRLVSMLDQQLLDQADKVKGPSFSISYPSGDHGVSVVALVGIGLVVVVAAYAGWYHFSNHPSLSNVMSAKNIPEMSNVPAAVEQQQPPKENTASSAASSQPSGSAPSEKKEDAPAQPSQQADLTPEPSRIDDHGPNDTSQSLPSLPPEAKDTSASADDKTPPSPFVKHVPQQEDSAKQPASLGNAASSVDDSHTVSVVMTEDSWVQIKNAQGKVLESRVMKKGESWQGRDDEGPYSLTAGNAGGVVVKAGSVTSAPLGRIGTVRRNVALVPQDVINGQYGHSEEPAQNTHER